MELYQLRGFAAVAETGHLTRAAERLHLSQPALSAQIKALEDELGVPLFERLPSGMELTPAGRSLLPEAQKVVAAAQEHFGKVADARKLLQTRAVAQRRDAADDAGDPEFLRLENLDTDLRPPADFEIPPALKAFAAVSGRFPK